MKFKSILFIIMAAFFSGSCESGFHDMIDESNMAKAALKSVTLSSGSLSPEFRSEKRAYSINPGDGVTVLTVVAVPEREDSTIKYRIDGGNWKDGDIIIEGVTAESLIKLEIKVTSGDGKGIVVYAFDVKQSSITPDRTCRVTFVCPEADIDPEFYSLTVETPGTAAGKLPVSPGRFAFAFAGWYTEENGGGTQFTKDTPVTGDITVHAYWKGGAVGLQYSAPIDGACSASWDGTTTLSGEIVISGYSADGGKVTEIAYQGFDGLTGITSVLIPDTVKYISDYAFDGCTNLASVNIPESVEIISSYAFRNCTSLPSVTIPAGVTTIGPAAFYGCSGLTSVTIPVGVKVIGTYTFSGCSGLTSVTIPEGVTAIGPNAFHSCSELTSVNIPGIVTTIGAYAFSNCSGLTGVTIPGSVSSIGDLAFSNCSSLISVRINRNSAPTIDTNTFLNLNFGACTLYSPGPTRDASYNAAPWSNFTNWSPLP